MIRRQRFDHRQRARQPGLVDHEEVPISIAANGDLPAWADGVDAVTDLRSTYPIRSGASPVHGDVDGDRGTGRIELPDRVAPVDDPVAATGTLSIRS